MPPTHSIGRLLHRGSTLGRGHLPPVRVRNVNGTCAVWTWRVGMIGNFILFQSLTYRGFLLKATRGRIFSIFFCFFHSHAWPQKAKKGGKHSHAWSYRHAWPSSATRGTSATCGLTGTSSATRGPAWPRVAELGHVWLHEFDTRKKRRSHTWAIQTWSWSAASLQPRVATRGTWFSSTRSFLSSFSLLATRGRQLTLSHARGATRGHTGHAWRGSF